MKKLDYELTNEVLQVVDESQLKSINERGVDFQTCSRLALDDVLHKIYNKKCNGTKEKAVEMLVALINGQDVPSDVDDTEGMVVQFEDNSPASQMDPEERMRKIAELVDEFVPNMKDYYMYCKKIIKLTEFKMLGASEQDLKHVAKSSKVAICGQGYASKKLYLMKREDEYIEIATKEGDGLFYDANDPKFQENN